jgi:hypothetical protein
MAGAPRSETTSNRRRAQEASGNRRTVPVADQRQKVCAHCCRTAPAFVANKLDLLSAFCYKPAALDALIPSSWP